MSTVYFFQRVDNGLIKIGRVNNPKDISRRAGEISKSINAKLDILGLIHNCVAHYETKLHQQFKCLRHTGEWFTPNSDLLEFIEQIKATRRRLQPDVVMVRARNQKPRLVAP